RPYCHGASRSPVLKTSAERRRDQDQRHYHHVEDQLSTVDAVGGTPQGRRLYVSGTAMTALSVDTKLMAYLPKVMRADASSFLDICFGMGSTYRSAINLGLHTDAVDLSRSEEHTSELQSHLNLVCRLLLEKKK